MEQFETLFVGVAVCSLLIAWLFPAMPYFRLAALFSLILAFCLHAHYEILRLGMAGTYLAAGILLVLLPFPSLSHPRLLLPVVITLSVLALSSVASATILRPLLAPAPTGPYLTGRIIPELTILEPPGAKYRRPSVEIWYPVDQEQSGLPLAYERHYRRDGILGAQISSSSSEKFPMLLYFSGGAGTIFDGVNIVRELVSWGYIVAAVSYPPSLPGLDAQAQEKRRADLERDLFNLTPTRAFEEVLAPIDERIRERALDAVQIVEEITRGSEDRRVRDIRSRLASDRVGIMGFSFGGAISAEAKTIDARFKAALNLDGWHFGSSVAGVPYPYFLMVSGESLDLYNSAKGSSSDDYAAALTLRDFERPIAKMQTLGGYLLEIKGSKHVNLGNGAFSGFHFRDPGTIDKYKVFEIMSRYALAFFDVHLRKGIRVSGGSDISISSYPEARFESWPPAKEVAVGKVSKAE